MTLTAIARKAADVAADEAHRSLSIARADRGCLPGIGTSTSGFADEHCRRVIAQAQAWSMFDSELTVRADFTGFYLQMATQGMGQLIASRQGTRGRAAHTHDGSAHRFSRKHRIKIDDTMHVGERHAQGVSHFHGNGFGNPAMEMLCSV
jgi:myo-inositol-hexaphosphate 3-phosphohydrolase